MLRHLRDPANAITMVGLVCSVAGLALALAGRPAAAVGMALWALMADHADGMVAARTRHRADETARVGKSLDSLADLASAAIFPAVLLLTLGDPSLLTLLPAFVLVAASALRLSHFNAVGLAGGRFVGVPTTQVLPCVAVLFLLRSLVPERAFAETLGLLLLVLAALHVSPVRFPKTQGLLLAATVLFCVLASAALIHGEFSSNPPVP